MAGQSIGLIITKLPSQYQAISKFNNAQFKLVVKANTGFTIPSVMQGAPRSVSLGVDVFRSEPFLQPLLRNWAKENTSLIKSIPSKFHDDVQGIIRRGVANGSSVKQLKDEIKGRYAVTDARAKLIAQDQVLKANADLTRYRLQSVGVKDFIWNSVGDSRVRTAHVALEGKKFSWDKPHPTEGLPGSKIRCRCRATPIFPDDE
jgi:SPP1 gp7 family putative phage head morphogenesis protein